ncbi:MAG: helix-turn-helix domain-containing protein [Emcibacter sp.]|nr:helix-turn-helix domain-containing protein [Emcibacter sp.]
MTTYLQKLLTEQEVAGFFGFKASTLRRWRWAGTGPKFRKIGGCVRYHPDDISDYVDSATRTNTTKMGKTICSG